MPPETVRLKPDTTGRGEDLFVRQWRVGEPLRQPMESGEPLSVRQWRVGGPLSVRPRRVRSLRSVRLQPDDARRGAQALPTPGGFQPRSTPEQYTHAA